MPRRSPTRRPPPALALVLLLVAGLTAACGHGGDAAPAGEPGGADVDLAPLVGSSPDWVDLFLPRQAAAGYNLVLYRRRVPVLIDMNGRVVHAWPGVRAAGRARLGDDGSLTVIAPDGAVREHSWEGELAWSYRLPDEHLLAHHDLIRLAGGNLLLVVRDERDGTDSLLEVARDGAVVWSWHSRDHLDRFAGVATAPPDDVTHVNSVQELPPNPWAAAGDRRFSPGNLLVSARNLSAVFVVDRGSGEPVWIWQEGLDYQHEAQMVPAGGAGEGQILLFDNGYHRTGADRASRIVAIDPPRREVVWEYRSPSFYSSHGGTQQPLPGGNVLVTSSQGGRVFEVTREGEIVWQWAPAYKPMRVRRYPYDHAPQLAALPAPRERRVSRRDPERFVDQDLYAFALPHEQVERRIAGRSRKILLRPAGCARLFLPDDGHLVLGHGPEPRSWRPGERWRGRLRVELTPLGGEGEGAGETVVLRSGPTGGEGAWLEPRFELAAWGRSAVRLCVELEAGSAHELVLAPPRVVSARLRRIRAELRSAAPGSAEERAEAEQRRRQLEALGYAD